MTRTTSAASPWHWAGSVIRRTGSVLTEVFDAQGARQGLLSFFHGDHGMSLDLMRRDPGSENGVMETMVAATVAAGPVIGVDRLSLNFAVMRAIFEEGAKIGAGPVMRASRGFLMFASRWWQLESLYRSNEKYEPDWVPRCSSNARVTFRGWGSPPVSPKGSSKTEAAVHRGGRESWLTATPILRWACGLRSPRSSRRRTPKTPPSSRDACRSRRSSGARKLEQIRSRGVDPYATDFERTDMIGDVRSGVRRARADARTGRVVRIAGRVMLNRVTGKLVFAQVKDWSGQIQVMLSLADVGQETSTAGSTRSTSGITSALSVRSSPASVANCPSWPPNSSSPRSAWYRCRTSMRGLRTGGADPAALRGPDRQRRVSGDGGPALDGDPRTSGVFVATGIPRG